VDRVKPSRVDPATSQPFTLEQELEPFGSWTSEPIWVPPKDSSWEMAKSMFSRHGIFTSKVKRWSSVVDQHRDNFTQVREIELTKASIRLPEGKLFVSVTEQKDFDRITDEVPDCVQTRLDEFLAGPGKQQGVKVYYLKPLCVEVDDQLIFTSREDLMTAVDKIRDEVFSEYRWIYLCSRPGQLLRATANAALAIPRTIATHLREHRQRALDTYQAKLEFQRRKTALRAARTHQRLRTDGCTFDEMLALTNPLQRNDVIEQFSIEKELSNAKRKQLLRMAAGHVPWFVSLSIGVSSVASACLSFTAPVMVCDPAFVAEFPDSDGVVMKIGHFDEVAGVRHVEL
jgi:hypothetical protein